MIIDNESRCVRLAVYMLENQATVRSTAKVFGISKSTVHKDLSSRLRTYDSALWREVRALLDKNTEERHIRGGMATKRKYLEANKAVDKSK